MNNNNKTSNNKKCKACSKCKNPKPLTEFETGKFICSKCRR